MATIKYYAIDSPELKGMATGSHLVLIGTKPQLELQAGNIAYHVNMAIAASDLQKPSLGPMGTLLYHVSEKLSPSFDAPASESTWLEIDGTTVKVTLGCLPTAIPSRHNSPSKPHAATDIVKGVASGDSPLRIVLLLASADHAVPLGTAVARAFSSYSQKSSVQHSSKPPRTVEVVFNMTSAYLAESKVMNGVLQGPMVDKIQALANGIQLAARLVDAPPNVMNTDAMVEEARMIVKRTKATGADVDILVVRGEELKEKGFGGIYGVGKAAEHPPALVVLSLNASSKVDEKHSVVWVGKGIVYDTGGLSIKTKTGMPGMKRDMGGAAAIAAAFEAAAHMGYNKGPLYAVLCLAENSVDSKATRPDDIHTLYSGKTVEINNTDAEGRLVLGDGVAYASKNLNPSVILDMATLTGAQGVATGKRHAALYTNCEALEDAAVLVGKETGDLAHPLPYAPEFFQNEFRSAVADMKNSVANRENAQSSCAGQFIASHLGEWIHTGRWLHVDMAYPSYQGERATGYGVNLLVGLLDKL